MTLNLTQHAPTAEQVTDGVSNLSTEKWNEVKKLITFDDLPDPREVIARATAVARIAADAGTERAMIGGAPYFMSALERALAAAGVKPVYAFSKRESVDEKQADGSIKKTQLFRHTGFVIVPFPSKPLGTLVQHVVRSTACAVPAC